MTASGVRSSCDTAATKLHLLTRQPLLPLRRRQDEHEARRQQSEHAETDHQIASTRLRHEGVERSRPMTQSHLPGAVRFPPATSTRRPSAPLDLRTMAIDIRADGGAPPRPPSSTSRESSSIRRSNNPAVTSAFDASIGVGAEL
jgi:hypothetical protein